jgi:hypothetical protein
MLTRARKSKDRDFFVNARRVVEQAIGEQMDGMPLEKEAHIRLTHYSL